MITLSWSLEVSESTLEGSERIKGTKTLQIAENNRHQNNVQCKFFENGRKIENLPIVLQERQGLYLIEAILCTTWEPYTKEELGQA